MAETKRKRARIKYPPTDNPKTCKTCGVEKPADRFFVVPWFKDGRDSTCKDCRNPAIVAKNSEPERRALINERMRAYKKTPAGKEQKRKDNIAEAIRRAEKAGRSYTPRSERPPPDPFKYAERDAKTAWRQWLSGRAPSNWLDSYYAAKPWIDHRLTPVERGRLRYRLDPDWNLRERVRLNEKSKARKRGVSAWHLRRAIKINGKYAPVWKICGYDIPTLRQHLERQFTRGMTWGKFHAGQIDIDHIIPLRCFDLGNIDEIKRAWALSNLRPMWPTENYQKGGGITQLL